MSKKLGLSLLLAFVLATGAITVEGVHVIDCRDAGATSVRLPLTVLPFHVADTFAVESLVNVPAFAVKVAEEAPAGIITDDGTLN